MEEISLFGREDAGLFKRFLACYDVPAYVRRARQIQDALDFLLGRCRQQRETLLRPVRSGLKLCWQVAGHPELLQRAIQNSERCRTILELGDSLGVPCPNSSQTSLSPRRLQQALDELQNSIVRFNRRWHAYLQQVDLEPINRLRAAYNRYYLLEKECALRSPRLARQGYVPLEPLRTEHLAAWLPGLQVV
jgi:hypothetical protein